MSMTKEQFLQLVRAKALELPGVFPPVNVADWIWDNLLEEVDFDGLDVMMVKFYEDFETPEEKAERIQVETEADRVRREAIRERTIEVQMERTGQDRATVERLMP